MPKIAFTLLVDDDNTANFLHQKLLLNMQVTEELQIARNGKEALAILEQQTTSPTVPTLVLLDIKMPVMNRFEFLEAFAKLPETQKQSVVIVVVSSSLNPNDLAKIQQANIAGYVTKPLTRKSLQAMIDQQFLN